jgi:hypothetical protein
MKLLGQITFNVEDGGLFTPKHIEKGINGLKTRVLSSNRESINNIEYDNFKVNPDYSFEMDITNEEIAIKDIELQKLINNEIDSIKLYRIYSPEDNFPTDILGMLNWRFLQIQ